VPLNFTPKKVVYAIALKSGEPVTPKTLFTFAQVAIYRTVRQLRAANIEVEIVTINRQRFGGRFSCEHQRNDTQPRVQVIMVRQQAA